MVLLYRRHLDYGQYIKAIRDRQSSIPMISRVMDRFLILMSIIVAALLNACVSSSDNTYTLADALEDNTAISIPMRITESGLIVLEGTRIDGQKLDMVMDTGATQSAIFQTTLRRLNLGLTSESNTLVHGMTQSKFHEVVKIPQFEIGALKFLEKPMVVLDDRESTFRKTNRFDGLIGMDILSNYQIYISPSINELRLIPNQRKVDVPSFWPRIFLKENPFQPDGRNLHFMDIRVAGQITHSLFDTGAEFSVMNWKAARYSQVRHIRRKLREEWELQGAIGVFRPTANIKLENIRSGQVFWENKSFIVLDFTRLDILGIEDKPFIIAGMNLFKGESFFMDFDRNFIALIPESNLDNLH